MKVTIVGSGDAFGTGGRAHTCFRIDSGGASALVDFGASSISSFKKLGLDFDAVDVVAISHLHGDHFGGLPFLLLDCQFVARRTKALVFVGPPGLRDRLFGALDVFFPGIARLDWSFPWRVEEIAPPGAAKFSCFRLETFDVIHSTGVAPTGLRLSDGKSVVAYSGDTAWTDTLLDVAAGADLFICECSSGDEPIVGHMDWPILKASLPRFSARRIVLTHMGASALARRGEIEQAGLTPAYDGLVIDL
jgi:ribonuclease BN (tRNA processing enzyme)